MNTENSLKLETKVKNLSRSIISIMIVRQNNEIVIKYQLQYGYIQCYFKRLNVMFTPGQTKTVYLLYGPTTDPSTEAIWSTKSLIATTIGIVRLEQYP